MLNGDIDAIRCRWVPYSVQLAAKGATALVTATRVRDVHHVASMATHEECKGELALLPSNGGYYNPLNQMYAESSDESDCD